MSSDSPIVKCSHCNQILSSEDFDKHECKWNLKSVKRISVIAFHDDSYKDQKIIRGYGTDGTVYTLVVTQRKPIPMVISLADEKKHVYKTDEEGTESAKKMFNRFSS
jgi:hypothetical protein